MTDTITLPRSVVAGALHALDLSQGLLESARSIHHTTVLEEYKSLRAALAQQALQVAQQAEQDEVGINGLTAAETRATMSVAGLSEPTKLTAYERKCFDDWKNQ